MQIEVVPRFQISLSRAEAEKILSMVNKIHKGVKYDATLLYKIEDELEKLLDIDFD